MLEGIFESETSWEVVYGNDELGENKLIICEAADKFALLLQILIGKHEYKLIVFQNQSIVGILQ